MTVLEIHDRCRRSATEITSYLMPTAILPKDVIAVLNKARIPFVLVGAYGLAGWLKEPRATKDVDVIVSARYVKKAVSVLLAAFPGLEPIDLPVVVRLRDRETQEVLIDVLKPVHQPHREVFHHVRTVESGGHVHRIPTLEMALVMKFSAMTSLYRADADKYQDAHDLILMVQKNADVDEATLAGLASLVYPEGGKDILEMVRKVRAGEKLSV